MIKKIPVILFVMLGSFSSGFAQPDNDMLRDEIKLTPADTQRLMLSFSNFDFLRNYEYFNKIQEGFTLFGYQLNPRLAFMPNKNLRLEAGIFVRKDYGNDKYTRIQPTFAVKASKNGYSLLIGNLESALSHRLIEPLYNFDNIINQRLENGGQLIIDKKRLWTDVWIDWQKAIYPGSPFQEQIWSGLSARITAAGVNKKLKLIIPVQALIFHNGGQIDTDSGSHVISIENLAGGIMLKWNASSEQNFIQELRTENYWVYYRDPSANPVTPVNDGSGIYLNASLKTCYHIEAMLSYWNGNNFISPLGAPLYQSVSTLYNYSEYHEENRQLLFLRLMYEQQWLPDFFVGIRFEPYYDLNNSLLEYSYSFFAAYKKDFTLVKLKRS